MKSSHSSAHPQFRVISTDGTATASALSDEDKLPDMTSESVSLAFIFDQTLPEGAPMSRPIGRFLKRALDLALAVPIVLFVLPPLCLAVKLVQILQSRGPLFFTQKRCGREGKEFQILKFRTMNLPRDGQCEIEDDPHSRIYPLGTLLRRSKLDEIPQFINVLLGSMSVVGPRPHHAADCETFASRVSEYAERFVAKPGITGLAQVAEYRGDFEWNCVESRVEKDLRYIREWSIMTDVRLVFDTVNIVTRRIASGVLRRVGITVPQTASPRAELAVFGQATKQKVPPTAVPTSEKRAA